MANRVTKLAATILSVAGISSLATVASAAPIANGLAIENPFPPPWSLCNGNAADGDIAADGAGAVWVQDLLPAR
jgi:hypothetical protein